MLNFKKKKDQFEWREDLSSQEWDDILTSMHGHPLQSAKWGDARKLTEGIKDVRWCAYKNEKPVYLVRFEERYFLKYIKIAWVPRGPTILDFNNELILQKEFLTRLKQKQFFLCCMSPWREIAIKKETITAQNTMWLNLKIGIEKLWENLHTTFRRHVRNAKRKGIIVKQSIEQKDMHTFYELCKSTSLEKGFNLHTSEKNMNYLILKNEHAKVTSHLFIAYQAGQLCGGLFVICCGESVHNWLTAVDRDFSKLSIGEVLHWEVTEWAVNQGYKIYDLEGIDEKNNHSVYYFKKKMGGKIVTFPGFQYYPLNNIANLIVLCFNARKFISLLFNNRKKEKIILSSSE